MSRKQSRENPVSFSQNSRRNPTSSSTDAITSSPHSLKDLYSPNASKMLNQRGKKVLRNHAFAASSYPSRRRAPSSVLGVSFRRTTSCETEKPAGSAGTDARQSSILFSLLYPRRRVCVTVGVCLVSSGLCRRLFSFNRLGHRVEDALLPCCCFLLLLLGFTRLAVSFTVPSLTVGLLCLLFCPLLPVCTQQGLLHNKLSEWNGRLPRPELITRQAKSQSEDLCFL